MYVNYLNQPKRAKHEKNSTCFVDFQPASTWSNGLPQEKNDLEYKDKKLNKFVDKTNLSIEMNFKIDKEQKSHKCGCSYRNQYCHRHAVYKNGIVSSHQGNVCSKKLLLKDQNFFKNNRLKFINGKVFKSKLTANGIQQQYFKKFSNLNLRQNGLNLSSNQGHFRKSYMFRRKNQSTLQHWRDQSNDKALVDITDQNSKSLMPTKCTVEADILCHCRTAPNVGHFSNLHSYKQECYNYVSRRTLAVCLILRFSTIGNWIRKGHLRKCEFCHICLPGILKHKITQWCNELSLSNDNDKYGHSIVEPAISQSVVHYSYFKKGVGSSTSKVTKGIQSVFLSPIPVVKLHLKCQNPSTLLKSHNVNNEETHNFKDETTESNDRNSLCKLHENASHHPSNCQMTCQKENNSFVNDINSSVTRVSSRLKKKRDSGIQGPYSEDFIVEVPTSKKPKKVKSSRPYSHPLFWNFYKSSKLTQNCKWKALSRKYFQIAPPNSDEIRSSRSVNTTGFWSGCSSVSTDDEDFLPVPDPKAITCFYCGLPFAGLTDVEKQTHLQRHNDISWKKFEAPLFYSKNYVMKQILQTEKKNDVTSAVNSPVKSDHKPNHMNGAFKRTFCPRTKNKLNSSLHTTQSTPKFTPLPLHKRATARKSNIAW